SDAHAVVAVQALGNARFTLMELQQALREPRFHLYLGRKSCPLAAPLDPILCEAGNFQQALDGYAVKPLLIGRNEWQSDERWLKQDELIHYYWEGSVDHFASGEPEFQRDHIQELVRHDSPLSR